MISVVSLPTNLTVSTNITATSVPKTRKQSRPLLNSDLRSLTKSGKLDEALRLIESSRSESAAAEPDLESYSLLLHACISRKSLEHGRRLYMHLLLSKERGNHDLLKNPILTSKFITLYSVCGLIDEARRVFQDGLKDEHVPESVWVAMAIGFSRNGYSKEALFVYRGMLSRLVQPGNFAFSMALKACTDLLEFSTGRAVHAQIIKCNEEADQVVNNALLRLYAECGCLDEVLRVFEEMPNRNLVSWNSLIAGYIRHEQVSESLGAFRRMQGEGIGFSWVTLTTVLPVCSQVTALNSGREIHAQIVKSTRKPDVPIINSLMNMYAKCGAIDYCRRVFEGMWSKDLTSWNTMLMGYAINGCIQDAVGIFNKMIESGIRPDPVTFIALLSGCSHGGLTEEGQRLFNKMRKHYGVSPTVEHYACLVDMLGRAGSIKEALEVVKLMPMRPSGSIWGSLLNSCRLHGKVSLGQVIAERLFEIEPSNQGNYVMLSNIYANAGMWDNVKAVREMMERRGMKKEVGCSWIQIKNRIHTFVAGGGYEFRNSAEYKKVWNELKNAMEVFGYVPRTDVVLHDVNEEIKAMWVCAHSERLATVFALIHTSTGMPIRITKNLRVCVDCHTWMKIVSRVTERVIVLRDTNRFHHFREGTCSCKDYW
ncbi:pentatricopeptide repeat-containing protein At3g14330 [Juglans microcarpa x Juglans regia]|uniref:pentatricopeptide repeat-containing protein At3g14330 n=1 Tax=Juglans microcarpa x Juglans regia TaxID=2249226 RepID=UPI001B7E0740|nr:pentatricopeptide repeat-containing protein At3g14330 [Juglans microcarpa x Juglans regia]XP_041002435.1 pentatricopeptide repeat-containing protein At3g14330 [Juglans microcarpa x Juglans regia]XP_041002436.1 pentatricopeptide repeat-containing protein At3g14330 [Juglans microcarpa x Juglans regia]